MHTLGFGSVRPGAGLGRIAEVFGTSQCCKGWSPDPDFLPRQSSAVIFRGGARFSLACWGRSGSWPEAPLPWSVVATVMAVAMATERAAGKSTFEDPLGIEWSQPPERGRLGSLPSQPSLLGHEPAEP